MKILLVAPRYPWPARRGDQLRTLQHLEILRREHDVQLLIPERPAESPPPPSELRVTHYATTTSGRAAGLLRATTEGWPLQAGLFHHAALGERLRELAPGVDRVLFVLVRLALHLEDVGETPVILDFVDSLSSNFQRRALFDRPFLRPFLRLEAKRLEAAERRLAEKVERCLVVGERDRWRFLGSWPAELECKLRVVRLRMDPASEPVALRPDPDPPRLVLTGNLGYFPTAEGVSWWLREVWPLLRRRLPSIELHLAGSRASRRLKKLAKGAGIELVVEPASLLPELRRGDLALAPMRAESGVPVKILEAWAEGVPVVTSPWAAQGAEGHSGEDLAVCGQPGEWVDTIVALLGDLAQRRRLAARGRRKLLELHSESAVAAQLAAALGTG